MTSEIPIRCPHLLSLDFNEHLAASSLSNVIGAVVDFQCTGQHQVLSGPQTIRCRTSGKWNDSLPTCVSSATTDFTNIYTDEVTVTTTPSGPEEQQVETVIIVLWIAGGLLLITLLLLIGCILKTHKKQQRRRNSSPRYPAQGQGDPRHGGVNPTFTSYDEIWTWIPVVTDNAENCRSQANASAAQRQNRTRNDSSRNPRLPSYNEAIQIAAGNRSTSQNTSSNVPVPRTSAGTSQNAQTNQNTLQIRPIIDRTNQTSGGNTTSQASVRNREEGQRSRSQDTQQGHRSTRTGHVAMESNPYETIPADQISTHRSNGNHVTYVSVTSSSGSALQEARDLVNRASAHAHRPLPSAPVLQNTNHAVQSNQRSNQRLTTSNVQPSSYITHSPSGNHVTYLPRTAQPASPDFNHSASSVFTYCGDHVQRVRNQQQQSRDSPPPPYSASRSQTQHQSGSRVPTVQSTNLPLRGIECHYF